MATKNDPVQLEKEADEALERMLAAEGLPQSEAEELITPEATEADNNQELADGVEDSPSESEDTEIEAEAADAKADAVGETEEALEETVETETSAIETPEEADKDGQSVDAEKLAQERIKNAQARMTKATQEAAELRRENDEIKKQLNELKDTVRSEQAMQSNAALDDLKREYPELASPLIDKIAQLEAQIAQSTSEIKEDSMQKELQDHFASIRAKHPDVDSLTDSEDFQGWLERQTPVWKRVSKEGSSDEVVSLLDKYKTEMGLVVEPSETKEQKVARAKIKAEPKLPKARESQLKGANKRIWTRSEIGSMSMDDFAKHEEDIDKAYAEGRIQ
jgi:hypothetical protein